MTTRLPARCAAALFLALAALIPGDSPQAQVVMPLPGGAVGQDVLPLAPTVANRRFAAAFAFSDQVITYAQGPGNGYAPQQTFTVGLSSNSLTDLPRRLRSIDANDDGREDILVLCSGFPPITQGSIQVLEQLSNASFAPGLAVPVPMMGVNSTPTNVIVEDFELSGRPLVVIGFSNTASIQTARPFAASHFQFFAPTPLAHATPALGSGNVLGDSRPELLVAGDSTLTVLGLDSTPMGSVSWQTLAVIPLPESGITSLAVADVQGDGRLEVLLATSGGGALLVSNLSGPGLPQTSQLVLTGPSQGGPRIFTHVDVADWNNDRFPDILLADNEHSEVVVLAGPDFTGTFTIPCGPGPRRFALADLDGSASPDLLTAAERDQPLTITWNGTMPAPQPETFDLEETDRLDSVALFDLSLPAARGFGGWDGERFVTYNPAGQFFIELDEDGQERDRFPLSALGGVAPPLALAGIDGIDEFHMIEGTTKRLLRIEDAEVVQVINIAVNEPLPSGFTDIAAVRDLSPSHPDQTRFWLAAPDLRAVFGISSIGAVTRRLDLPAPFTAIAFNSGSRTLYLGGRGSSELHTVSVDNYPVTANVNPTAVPSSSLPPEVRGSGIAALEWMEDFGLCALTARFVVTSLGNPQGGGSGLEKLGPAALRRGRSIRSLAVDAPRASLWMLDDNGLDELHEVDMVSGTRLRTFPTRTLLNAVPAPMPALPAHVAWDETRQRLVLCESYRPRFSAISRAGSLLGQTEWPTANAPGTNITPPINGFTVDPTNGDYLLMTSRGVMRASPTGTGASFVPLECTALRGLTLGVENTLQTLNPADFRVDRYFPTEGPLRRSGFVDPFTQDVQAGLAFREADRTWILSSAETGEILFLSEIRVASVGNPAWLDVE